MREHSGYIAIRKREWQPSLQISAQIAWTLAVELTRSECSQYPAGLRTPLIVEDPDDKFYYQYDDDKTMQFSDNWYQTMSKVDAHYNGEGQAGCTHLKDSTITGLEVPPDCR